MTWEFIQKWLIGTQLGKLSLALIGILVVWIFIQFTQKRLLGKISNNDDRYRTRKLATFLGYVLTVILLVVVYSKELGNLAVILGVVGAGIVFALQEVIASIAGWLAVMFGNFYKTGDRVQLGGIKGDVIDINVLRTTLMETGQWINGDLYNGRIVKVANSFVFKEPVVNYSMDFPFLWDEIQLPIRYGSDYELAKKIVLEKAYEVVGDYAKTAADTWKIMVQKYLIENASTMPMVSIVANDNWVELTLRYTVELKKRRLTKDQLFTKILTALDATNGKIQLASATYEIVGLPPIKMDNK